MTLWHPVGAGPCLLLWRLLDGGPHGLLPGKAITVVETPAVPHPTRLTRLRA